MDEILEFSRDSKLALESEYCLTACLLRDSQATIDAVSRILSAEDFQNKTCGAIYAATLQMITGGELYDPALIQNRAVEMGATIDSGFCKEVKETYTTTQNAALHAEIIHEAAKNRRAAAIGIDLANHNITILEAVRKLQELMTTGNKKFISMLEMVTSYTDYLFSENKEPRWISTGFEKLDVMLGGGIRKGALVTLAARSGMGKTTAALNIARNVISTGKKVGFIEFEMDKDQIMERMAGIETGLGCAEIGSGRFLANDEKVAHYMGTMNHLSKKDFKFYYGAATAEDIEQIIRGEGHLDLVIIDYVGLIKDASGANDIRRYEIMTAVSHRLKQIALSTGIPILAAAQLNRACEAREDKRPRMSDLRDSGALEEDSDVVILLFREAYYLPDDQKPKPSEPQEVDFLVDKNRHGTTGTVTLTYTAYNAQIKGEKCA